MLSTLLNAQPPIPLHAICALAALVVGGMQMSMQKGTALHIAVGRVWIALMTIVAISSFFIYDLKVWGNYRLFNSYSHALDFDKPWGWTLLNTQRRH